MRRLLMVGLMLLGSALHAQAANEAGTIKTLQGNVNIERAGKTLEAKVGMPVYESDTLVTGPKGTVGITLTDGSRLTAGPRSTLALNQYAFDTTTHEGEIDASLKQGVMAVISGKISKNNPEQVKYRTQHSIIGVRGTEFIIEAGESL